MFKFQGRFLALLFVGTMLGALWAPHMAAATEAPALVLDEDVWVTFYDVPSRRFRSVRDAFVRKDFVDAARDLDVAIGFLTVELDRAPDSLEPAMAELVATLENLRLNLFDQGVAVGDLDAAFARGHWLLAQQYLAFARSSRDASEAAATGNYLWAAAHHLERAVLWSNATIDKDVVKSLDAIRKMAVQLRNSDNPQRVFREKPVAAMTRTLVRVGEHLERPVRIAVPKK